MLIGVYGTLKKGHYNHSFIKGNGRFIKHYMLPYYKMFSLGYFPIAIPSTSADDKILIEIYDVNESSYKRMRSMELGAGYIEIDQPIETNIVKMWIYPSLKKVIKYTTPEFIKDGVWTKDHENFAFKDDIKMDYDLSSLEGIDLDYSDFEKETEDDYQDSWMDDKDDYDNDDYIFLRELDTAIKNDENVMDYFDPTIACNCELEGIKPSWAWDNNLKVWRCEKCNVVQD